MHLFSNRVKYFLYVDVSFSAGLHELSSYFVSHRFPFAFLDCPIPLEVALGGCDSDDDVLVGKVADVLEPGAQVFEGPTVIDGVSLRLRDMVQVGQLLLLDRWFQ